MLVFTSTVNHKGISYPTKIIMQPHFEVQRKQGRRSDRASSISEPSQYPTFVLCFNYNWNDLGTYSWFSLIYCEQVGIEHRFVLGELKILQDGEDNTFDVLPTSFDHLEDGFYSLGIETTYYENLHRKFGTTDSQTILYALKDCAVYPQIKEEHKSDSNYESSLIRDLSSERALREGKSIISGVDMEKIYHIDYLFYADYNEDSPDAYAEIRLNFSYRPKPFYRCACIIGENGTGKTSFVRKFINNYINHDDKNFKERPNFSSLLLAYSTQFDGYKDLNDSEGALSFHKLCTDQSPEYTNSFMKSAIPCIHKRMYRSQGMFPIYVRAITQHILVNEEPDFRYVYRLYMDEKGIERIEVKEQELTDFVKKLSSGQLQQLLLVTFIYRYMNFDTLIFFDEPEIHLHPQAIDRFFKMLSQFLIMFQSYCIVVTHSPIVVREVMGKKVFVLSRDNNNIPTIAPCGIETFGEDISYLYERLYHYHDDMSNFRTMVKQAIKLRGTTDEVEIRRYIAPSTKLSLNSRYIIHSICEEASHVQN